MSAPKRVLLPSLIDELPLPPTPPSDLRLHLPHSPGALFDNYTQSPIQQTASPSHPQPSHSSSSLSMSFIPFFTLISATTSNQPSTGRAAATPEHNHPTVHYIFSDDDDSDLITEAALLSLQSQDPTSDPTGLTTSTSRSTSRVLDRRKHHAHLTRVSTEDSSDAVGDGEGDALSRTNTLQARQKGGRERYIVLDVVPNQPSPNTTLQGDDTTTSLNAPIAIGGTPTTAHPDRAPKDPPFTISAAHSLDPDFAVLSASLSPAPTFEHDADTPAPSQSGWMLNISGIMNTGPSSARDVEKVPAGVTVEALEDLAERFEREMGVLRGLMGRGLPHVELEAVEGERILGHANEGVEHGEQLIADVEVAVDEPERVADG